VWREEKLPFELMFFPTGRGYQDAVRINTVEGGVAKRLELDTEMFDYGRNRLDARKLRGMGFAGFRVHYPINKPSYKDEVVVFLGASYFRAVGQGQVYGLSARGLAVDTATASGEEFPRFSEFWIERPNARATTLTIYGLLDSKHVTGAYKFVLAPGKETVMTVNSRLYARDTTAKLGIAAMHTMYAFGENQPGNRDDYRPEVHDSDGLSVLTGEGEWLWRPYVNPKRLLVTSFATANPRGFGSMQRDRASSSYEDPDAQYERRPSLWIEPIGSWARAGSSSCRSRRPTRPTTTSSSTGCPMRRRSSASRSITTTACAGRCRGRCRSAEATWCRRGAAAATCASPTAT